MRSISDDDGIGKAIGQLVEQHEAGSLKGLALVAILEDGSVGRSLLGEFDPVVIVGSLQMLAAYIFSREFGENQFQVSARSRLLC